MKVKLKLTKDKMLIIVHGNKKGKRLHNYFKAAAVSGPIAPSACITRNGKTVCIFNTITESK